MYMYHILLLNFINQICLVLQDMFTRLDPVRSDFGLKMMKKMGWVEGTPLGKTGVGHIVPPVLSFQVDRKGT